MRIMTICGTRPEIIRLSLIINKLDKVCDHVFVYTNQSYDANMSDVFFTELGVRSPDYTLATQGGSFGTRLGKILQQTEMVLNGSKVGDKPLKPDKVLVLGDTNSALSAYMVKRMGGSVYHMEAGNRCFDDNVPEEINRRVIDHCVDVHMPYVERGRLNLLAEGISPGSIFVIGNPIYEVIADKKDTDILSRLKLKHGKYYLVTAHREENVENSRRLDNILTACNALAGGKKPVIFSRHPRTKRIMTDNDMAFPDINFQEPFGLLDFLTLERHATCVITDSGTVQEECCINRVRCVTIRDSTERQETLECGSNIICGVNPVDITKAVRMVLDRPTDWEIPHGYLSKRVSDKVVNILMGAKI